jgi:choline dehydrogenase-like flavoprotein
MLLDFRHCDVESLEADVCIVGAGATGLPLAHGLLGSGLRVLILESGGARPDERLEALNEGSNIGSSTLELSASRRRVFGGATTLWAGQCVRLEEQDLLPRPWVPDSGWPLRASDLESSYRRLESLLRIEGARYDEGNWSDFGIPAPALDPRHLHARFTVWPRRVNLGRIVRKTFAQATDIRLLLYATTTELILDEPGRSVSSLRVQAMEGRSAEIRARQFVLCAGAIENARLLLASRGRQPDGVGNHHDLVGRFLQDHPNAVVAALDSRDPSYLQDRFALLYRRGQRFLARMLLSPSVQEAEQVLNAAAVIRFEYPENSGLNSLRELVRTHRAGGRPDRIGHRLIALLGDLSSLARAGRRRYMLGRSPATAPERIAVQIFSEQAPNRHSRITLSRQRDPLGMPMPEVDWRLSSSEGRTFQVMLRELDREIGRLGLGHLQPEPWIERAADSPAAFLRDSFHTMGTTRMAFDPRHGVVDSDLRVHGLENLYVSGASTFPTSSWANPTLTAMALSARLADHLRERSGVPGHPPHAR